MRITLVISTLAAGGAERVMALMANYWGGQGHDVTLITLDPVDQDFYALHPAVVRVGLGLSCASSTVLQGLLNNIARIKRLRGAIDRAKPDIVISFVEKTNVLALLSTVGSHVPVVVSERIDPRFHRIERLWAFLRWLLYRRANALVVQTDGLRTWAEGFINQRAVYVIPNPLSIKVSRKEMHGDCPEKIVASMGRLVAQKGFDNLLQAFARCVRSHPEWSLVIIGEGPERPRLNVMTVELGIQSRVRLVGCLSDPFEILRGAELFILASRYEGFPNALVEAMACRLPVVSTDCPSGPRDIIRDGVDGVLVPPDDVAALAEAMDRLMDNPQERQRLRTRAVDVLERFSAEKIMKSWSDLLMHVAGPTHAPVARAVPRI